MAYDVTSKFVQITPYLLMEYRYADQPQPETHPTKTGPDTVGYNKLINGFDGGIPQIYNPTRDYDITYNTSDNSVVKMSTNSFVTLDSNLIIPFNDYADELTNTDEVEIVFPSNIVVVYDTIRYHIRAGYNLGNIDGLIMSVEFQDQNLTYMPVSQILIKKGTEQNYTLNPSPVKIGSNIYDKYFEIKIPNIKDMNDKYLVASTYFKPSTLAGLISYSGTGFYYGAPIRITAWQVETTDDYNGYAKYNTTKIATLSLEEEDPFSNIGATIKESAKGQFYEYYATDNEGFIEDFILFQNSIGNSYYLSHQIEVFEQIGAALIQTSHFESIQTTAYDTTNYYRPIIINAGVASSFMLRYTMTLINSKDQSRTIRISAYTSNSPSQWGTNIAPIELSNFPQVQKIYNRVYSHPAINLGGGTAIRPREIVKYTNVFIDQNYVTVTLNNLTFTNSNLNIDTTESTTIAYGTGKLTIIVSPFDNYFKLKFIKSSISGDPIPIDLTSSGDFNISFIDNVGKKIQISALKDNNLASPNLGELAFKIDETISTQILQLSDRRFFITNIISNTISSTDVSATTTNYTNINKIPTSTNNANSVMYWGYWKKQGEIDIIETPGITGPCPVIQPVPVEAPILEAPSPIIKNITPAGTSGGTTGDTSTGNFFDTLKGAALIAALSAEMAGYKALGWADVTILKYFTTEGKPGYIKYPGLTAADIAAASKGILTQTSIDAVVTKARTRGGLLGKVKKIIKKL
jgi:hypothetical protein